MKLLRVDSVLSEDGPLILEEYTGGDIPLYAILSHTGVDNEVLYQHLLKDSARDRKGFMKIKYTAKQAQKDELEYVWVDTCCIDKSSSAELQEAINSMYAWYSESAKCYVYLSDMFRSAANKEND